MGCEQADPREAMLEKEREVLEMARKNNDWNVATQAIYNILALSPADSAYRDSLAMLYYDRGAFVQAIQVGNKLLQQRPNDTVLVEMMAIAKESAGQLKESLEHYQQLYEDTRKPYYLYQIASIEFKLRRFNESAVTLNKLLSQEGLEDETVIITYERGRQQRVPIQAAAINIQGVLALEMEKFDLAKQAFEQALQLAPEFQLAKNNLQALKNQSQQASVGQS